MVSTVLLENNLDECAAELDSAIGRLRGEQLEGAAQKPISLETALARQYELTGDDAACAAEGLDGETNPDTASVLLALSQCLNAR